MKRDIELVRKILLNAQDGKDNSLIDGVTDDALKYHQALLIEANLVKGSVIENNQLDSDIPITVSIKKITWEGHDFISAIEDEDKWSKIKKHLKEGGKILTLETIKLAVKQLFM